MSLASALRAYNRQMQQIEGNIRGIYSRAQKEVGEAWTAYMKKADAELKPLQDAYAAAKRSGDKDEIKRTGMALGRAQREKTIHNKYYQDLTNQLAGEISQVNERAVAYINSQIPAAYVSGYNEVAKDVSSAVKGYSFTLVDEATVKHLANEDKTILPYKEINDQKDVRWNTAKVNGEVLQGILQGEPVTKIAGRLSDVLGMNRSSSIRNARTGFTSAQNKGRMDMLDKAAANGIVVKKEWIAALDDHTRETHAEMDGELQDYDDPFSNDLMYPGDPDGAPEEVYNCRCRMGFHVTGVKDTESGEFLFQDEDIVSDSSRRVRPEQPEPQQQRTPAATQPAGQTKPGTIAGVEKGEPMSHRDADTGKVNPHIGEGGGYRINCQSCVATYEARLRGYDVEVVPNDKAHPMCKTLSRDTKMIWKNADGSKAEFMYGDRWISKSAWAGEYPTAKRFEEKLKKDLSEDGRYHLGFSWRGMRAGHIVTLEKDGPDLVIYDPQVNRLYRGEQVSKYLDRIAYKRTFYGETLYQWPEVIRVDDKIFDYNVASAVMIPAGG